MVVYFVFKEYIYLKLFSPVEISYVADGSTERCEAMSTAMADTSGRGRFGLLKYRRDCCETDVDTPKGYIGMAKTEDERMG